MRTIDSIAKHAVQNIKWTDHRLTTEYIMVRPYNGKTLYWREVFTHHISSDRKHVAARLRQVRRNVRARMRADDCS